MLFGGLTFDFFPCYEEWPHFILRECMPVLLDVVCQCFYDCPLGCGTEGVFLHDGGFCIIFTRIFTASKICLRFSIRLRGCLSLTRLSIHLHLN